MPLGSLHIYKNTYKLFTNNKNLKIEPKLCDAWMLGEPNHVDNKQCFQIELGLDQIYAYILNMIVLINSYFYLNILLF